MSAQFSNISQIKSKGVYELQTSPMSCSARDNSKEFNNWKKCDDPETIAELTVGIEFNCNRADTFPVRINRRKSIRALFRIECAFVASGIVALRIAIIVLVAVSISSCGMSDSMYFARFVRACIEPFIRSNWRWFSLPLQNWSFPAVGERRSFFWWKPLRIFPPFFFKWFNGNVLGELPPFIPLAGTILPFSLEELPFMSCWLWSPSTLTDCIALSNSFTTKEGSVDSVAPLQIFSYNSWSIWTAVNEKHRIDEATNQRCKISLRQQNEKTYLYELHSVAAWSFRFDIGPIICRPPETTFESCSYNYELVRLWEWSTMLLPTHRPVIWGLLSNCCCFCCCCWDWPRRTQSIISLDYRAKYTPQLFSIGGHRPKVRYKQLDHLHLWLKLETVEQCASTHPDVSRTSIFACIVESLHQSYLVQPNMCVVFRHRGTAIRMETIPTTTP